MHEEIARIFENVSIEAPSISVADTDERSGTLTVEPLLSGYGTTLGNSLRRVLLSSLPGSAVTKIKVSSNGKQALHEFSTLDGVKEDLTEIVLNVKGIVGRLYSKTPVTFYIDKSLPGTVTAGDIQCRAELEIVNPEHHIATISDNVSFRMELTFANGVGYVSAEKNKELYGDGTIGVIFVDSIYSPVQQVNFTAERMRVGSNLDYERLRLDVMTNGSIRPQASITVASQILRAHYSMIASLGGSSEEPSLLVPSDDAVPHKNSTTAIEELDFTVRSFNCLKRAGINTVGEITEKSLAEMMKIRNLGQKSLDEITEKLRAMGLSFREEDQ
ncbi:MAG TPA: DNA-directed RNA polymerase subunit alpha [Ruminococcaceae bacterium]|nr:DNA-directed RNA polymerase subunit alpha [Oscillospiraceae bacterium]